jgi:hypothetical protein
MIIGWPTQCKRLLVVSPNAHPLRDVSGSKQANAKRISGRFPSPTMHKLNPFALITLLIINGIESNVVYSSQ